jgi:hypothetical protein
MSDRHCKACNAVLTAGNDCPLVLNGVTLPPLCFGCLGRELTWAAKVSASGMTLRAGKPSDGAGGSLFSAVADVRRQAVPGALVSLPAPERNNAVRRVTRNGVDVQILESHCCGWETEAYVAELPARFARLPFCRGWFDVDPFAYKIGALLGDGYVIETANAGRFKARVVAAKTATGRCEFISDGGQLDAKMVRILTASEADGPVVVDCATAACECGAAKANTTHAAWCPAGGK